MIDVLRNNLTSIKGVHVENNGRFSAKISHQGKRHYLGMFKDANQARQARVEAANRLFGPEFLHVSERE